MSYAGAGVTAPSDLSDADPVTFFKPTFDHIFSVFNANDDIVTGAVATATASKLVMRGAAADANFGFLGVTPLAPSGSQGLLVSLPNLHTGNAIQALYNSSNIFAVSKDGHITTPGVLTTGSGAHQITTAAGLLDMTMASGILPTANGGFSVAPGAAGNLLTSNGTIWTAGTFDPSASLTDGSIPYTKLIGKAVATGAATVTVTAPPHYDTVGNWVVPTSHVYTMSAPSGGNQWVLLYYDDINGGYLSTGSTVTGSPTKPQGLSNTIPLAQVFLRNGSALVFQTDQTHDGYISDDRSPLMFMDGPSAVSGGASVWGVGQGGTAAGTAAGARSNLGAAAAGVNADITRLSNSNLTITAPKQVGALYFGPTGNLGVNGPATDDTWMRPVTFDGTRTLETGYFYSAPAITQTSARILNAYYQADSRGANTTLLGSPYGIGLLGDSVQVTVGATSAPAYGSVLGIYPVIEVQNVADHLNEHSPLNATLRYDNAGSLNADGTANAHIGRGWMGDLHMQGAVAVQQSGLSGLHMTPVNYYNGSPSGVFAGVIGTATGFYDPTTDPAASTNTNNASAAFVASTMYGLGLGAANAHDAATTYPMDIAFHGSGASGSTGSPGQTQGFRYVFMAGGVAGNYGGVYGTTARIGTGLFVRDHEVAGIQLFNRYAGTADAHALIVGAGAGNALFGTLLSAPVQHLGTTATTGTKSYVQIGDGFVNSLTQSSFFAVNGQNISQTGGNGTILASFGGHAGTGSNPTMLNVKAVRNANGATQATIALGLAFDYVSGGVANSNITALWLAGNGNIGIGPSNYAPAYGLDLAVGITSIFRTAPVIAGFMGWTTNGAAATIGSNGTTITPTNEVHNVNITPGNVTGLIMASGTTDGQTVRVINIGSFTGTMATAATSHVAGGTGCVIPALGQKVFTWNAAGGFWYSN